MHSETPPLPIIMLRNETVDKTKMATDRFGSACGLNNKFYKPTMGPKYVRDRHYNL